jgi:hypothetical protein
MSNLLQQISYRVYSDSADKVITGFTYLGIINRGSGDITFYRDHPNVGGNDYYIVETGQAFSFPFQESEYDNCTILAGGNDYSIITDGVIT